MEDFKNWRYIVSKGCYRYTISSNIAYEIFIKYWDPDTPIKTAKASLCRTKTSRCLVPDWYLNNEVTMTEREWLGEELPIPELLEIAYKDNKLIEKKINRVMTIETKYNIGQEVWALDFFKEPNKGEIRSVTTLNTSAKERDYISYYIHHIGNRLEYEIFPTKEELLKSL